MRTSAEVEEFESILVLASLDAESALVIREKKRRGGSASYLHKWVPVDHW